MRTNPKTPTFSADLEVNDFIDENETILQVRKTQTLGKQRLRSERVTLKMKKVLYKYFGSDANLNETDSLSVARQGSFMLLEEISGEQALNAFGKKPIDSNVEIPLNLDMREMVTEYELWGLYDYMKDVGSFLAITFILVLLIFYLVGFVFMRSFVTQFKQLIQRKYQEAYYLH